MNSDEIEEMADYELHDAFKKIVHVMRCRGMLDVCDSPTENNDHYQKMKADFEKYIQKKNWRIANRYAISISDLEHHINQFAEDYAKEVRFEKDDQTYDFMKHTISFYEKMKNVGWSKKQFTNEAFRFLDKCIDDFKQLNQ